MDPSGEELIPVNPDTFVPIHFSTRDDIAHIMSSKRQHVNENFTRVVSGSNSFSSPYRNSAPIVNPDFAEFSSFKFVTKYIEYCVSEDVDINNNLLMIPIIQHLEDHANPNRSQSAKDIGKGFKITHDILISNDVHCPVCQEDFKIEEEVRQLPCKHLYHKDCIQPWLAQSDRCPCCRFYFSDPINEWLHASWISEPQLDLLLVKKYGELQ